MQLEIWMEYKVTWIEKVDYEGAKHLVDIDDVTQWVEEPHYRFERAFSNFKSRKAAKDFIKAQIKYFKKYNFCKSRKNPRNYRIDWVWHFSYRKDHCDMIPKYWKTIKTKMWDRVPNTYKGLPVDGSFISILRDRSKEV